jgi:hypothetical protein
MNNASSFKAFSRTQPALESTSAFKRHLKIEFESEMFRKILLLLDAGNYPSNVARMLHLSPQRVAYHVKKAQKMGILERVNESGWLSFYEVSPAFKKNLTWGEMGVCRLHCFGLKFRVVRDCGVVDWEKVGMVNWDRFVGVECGVSVEKTSNSVIVWASDVCSRDSEEARLLAVMQCLQVACYLCSKFGMELDLFHPSLVRKPHYAVKDPVADVFSGFMEVSDDVGKMDSSEGVGEIDFYSAEHAKEYLLMPFRLQRIERRLQRLESRLTTILQTWNLVGNNLLDLLTRLQQVGGKEVVSNG